MHTSTSTTKCFSLGQTVITANARDNLDAADVLSAWRRHARGDWGGVSEADRAEHERSLRGGLRVLSAYTDRKGKQFRIVTEADRSAATVLLPEAY